MKNVDILNTGILHDVPARINIQCLLLVILIFTSKHMGRKRKYPPPEIVLTSVFAWLKNNLNFPLLKCISAPNVVLSSHLEQSGRNLAINLRTIVYQMKYFNKIVKMQQPKKAETRIKVDFFLERAKILS